MVGHWLIDQDGDNRVVVNGRAWSRGQPAASKDDSAAYFDDLQIEC